jgi:hypothetical protein
MGEKLVVGPVNKGFRNDREPFVIDNDSFPTLLNAYQWRGRVKRKRGTALLTRLTRYFNSTISSYNPSSLSITLDANGNGNLIVGYAFQTNSSIVPGSVTITDTATSTVYTDPSMNGTLSPSGTINYVTGAIVITAAAGHLISTTLEYYPDLPVMGLEDFVSVLTEYPSTIAFDTTYAYNIQTSSPFNSYSVSFYKNPTSATYPGYAAKSTPTPTNWNGQNYQQFWTTNYQGALWATNGITEPFTTTNIGMQFKLITGMTITSATSPNGPSLVSFTIVGHGLVQGDFVFINEVVYTAPNTTNSVNFQTGYVTTVTNANTVVVEFPNAYLTGTYSSGGIAQYLTSQANSTLDCLRWYDGDPTNGSIMTPALTGHLGWVNFAPPLSNGNYSIADLPAAQYYLVGARLIYPFKDRLIFFGPVIQTSSPSSQVFLQDTIIYSQNGTAYYTCSFTGDPSLVTTTFTPILVPTNQTANAPAYWENQTGFGGFLTAGNDQAIVSLGVNEDVLIVQFERSMSRLISTGNDVLAFGFFNINSEWGTIGTFSSITMDQGVISLGNRGFIITGQTSSQRIDLDIPNEVFEIGLQNNGAERICSQRDFRNEWIYFSFVPAIEDDEEITTDIFPSQTLQYNYRENTWAIFNESYTTYGTFRALSGFTWATVGNTFPTWIDWNEAWNIGSVSQIQPEVIAGNSQGFVILRVQGTSEAESLYIENISFPTTITGATQAAQAVLTMNNNFVPGQMITISGIVGMTQLNGNSYTVVTASPTTVTINVNSTGFTMYVSGGVATPVGPIYSPGHSLDANDYIIISGTLGTISSQVNEKIFSVVVLTNDYIDVNPPLSSGFTYLGGGLITKMYAPLIQTKQFPTAWGNARKTRLGPQQYLLTTTANSQITLLIFLSQDASTPYNYTGFPLAPNNIIPTPNSTNDSLIYSAVLYTCPESTNLGLTPANVNLQMPTATSQVQTWHRMNTSLIGDTVQIGFSLNDQQMRSLSPVGPPLTITGATQAYPCVLTCAGQPNNNQLVLITGVGGMIQLNNNYYNIISSTATTITIDVNATGFGAYTSGGTAQIVSPQNQFAEIELHGFILDVTPSQVLA